MLNNKRGDIPVTILVIGVFGICVLAILSFNFSLSPNKTLFVGPYLIEDVASISEQISFYNEKGVNFDSLLSKVETTKGHLSTIGSIIGHSNLKIKQNPDGSYLIKEEFGNGNGLIFSVEYPFTP